MPEPWTERGIELAGAPVNGPYQALLLARAGGPAFRPSELMRLAHLAGLAGSMVASEVRAARQGRVLVTSSLMARLLLSRRGGAL